MSKKTKNNVEIRLTSESIPATTMARVEEKLRRARVQLLRFQPFFGNLSTRLFLAPADAWLETMAVDGRYLYYNHQFVELLSPKELEFVLSHEILHLVFDHLGRKEFRNHKLYNCAADYVVNDELIVAKIGEFPTSVGGLHDVKYRGWNSEKVYEDLDKQQSKKSKSQAEQDLDDLVSQLLDEHLDGNSPGGNGENDGQPGTGTGKPEKPEKPGKTGPVKMSEAEQQQMREQIKHNVIAAAQLAKMSSNGTIPAGVERLVNELTCPKMNWRELLQAQLNSLIPHDYSFMRPSRNGWHLEAIMPGVVNEQMINIVIALDMSGSIDQAQANIFLSEVQGIMDQYQAFTIKVFCFDTKCYNEQIFSSDNGDDIRSYKCKGGGGTDGAAIFKHLKETGEEPEKLVIFTDGYVGDFGDPNYCDTVWVIKDSNVVPPFGLYAPFNEL